MGNPTKKQLLLQLEESQKTIFLLALRAGYACSTIERLNSKGDPAASLDAEMLQEAIEAAKVAQHGR